MIPTLRSWVRFLRLPAVLSVPGDLWVGAVVVGRAVSVREILAVCAAYLFGMALNDLVDRNRDAEHRPERPLPRGDLSAGAARAGCVGLAGAALALHPAFATGLLLATIVSYTLWKSAAPGAGVGLMGLCRFQSVWIGMGAGYGFSPREWMVPAGAGVVIAAITRLAQLEGGTVSGRLRSAVAAAAISAAAVWGVVEGGKQGPASWALLGGVIGVAIANHAGIERLGRVPPKAVGVYLSLWIPLQAIWVLGRGAAGAGAVLVAFAILQPWWIRRVAIS